MTKLLTALMLTCACILAGDAGAGVISADSVSTAVVDTLAAIAAERGLDVEIEATLSRDVEIDDADVLTMRLEIPGDNPLARRVPVKIVIAAPDGDIMRLVTVVARVRTFATAAVAMSDIPRETPLAQGDIEFRRVDVTGAEEYLAAGTPIEDLQAGRHLRVGTILTSRNVEPVPLVRRGERVTIRASVGSVTVTAEGTAREDGGRNERIRVHTEATNKTITCLVVEPGMVIASR